MSKLAQVINSLTFEQADQWDCETDKWVYIDDMILAPNGLRATEFNVNTIENAFDMMLGRSVELSMDEWEVIKRAMQWPEDRAQYDKDHDKTPTNMGRFAVSNITIL